MSARKTGHGTVMIKCDTPDCTATLGSLDTYPTDYAARIDAADLGWATYIGSLPFRDRCPNHNTRTDEQ